MTHLLQNLAIGAISGLAAAWLPICELDRGTGRGRFLRPSSRRWLSFGIACGVASVAIRLFRPQSVRESAPDGGWRPILLSALVGVSTAERGLLIALRQRMIGGRGSAGRGSLMIMALASLACFLTYNPLEFLQRIGWGGHPAMEASLVPNP